MHSLLQNLRSHVSYLLFFYGLRSRVYQYENLTLLEDDELLIATKRGLYLACNKALTTLLYGQYYGVTKFDGNWIVFENYNGQGRIIRFSLENRKIKDTPEVIFTNLSSGCHQIEAIGSVLYITDTYNNRILTFDLVDKCFLNEFYPTQKLIHGRKDLNYNHINSIYIVSNKIYLMAHNETRKTGKNSQILECDASFKLHRIIQTKAVNAHNIVVLDGRMYYCDSMNNALCIDEDRVLEVDHFTRGLAISDKRIYLGGSEYGKREVRDQLSGALYILDRDGNKLMTRIPIPTMVQEVRLINKKDLGLSQHG
jgi:hypothetical protein